MKTIFTKISNTYRAIQILSNPEVAEFISKKINQERSAERGQRFTHKHFIVQVVN